MPACLKLLSRGHRRAATVASGVVLGWAAFTMFWSLGNHPFYFPGEMQHAALTDGGSIGQAIRTFSAKLIGEGELARRLPGAISTVLAALCAGLIASRWRDGITGLLAALFLLLMPWCAAWGRVAVDPALIVGWVCIPFAIGLAAVGRRWLEDEAEARRAPGLMLLTAIGVSVVLIGSVVGLMLPSVRSSVDLDPQIVGPMLRLLLQGLVCMAGVWFAVSLYRKPMRRVWAMILLAASMACVLTLGLSVEDALTRKNSVAMLLSDLDEQLEHNGQIALVGIDPAPFAYYGRDTWRVVDDAPLVVVRVDPQQAHSGQARDTREGFEKLMDWRRPFDRYEVWVKSDMARRPAPSTPQ